MEVDTSLPGLVAAPSSGQASDTASAEAETVQPAVPGSSLLNGSDEAGDENISPLINLFDPPPVKLRPRSGIPAPEKGILKPPSVQQARFSFKRDFLQPFNNRVYSTAYGTAEPVLNGGGEGLKALTSTSAAVMGNLFGSALKKISTVAGAPNTPLKDPESPNSSFRRQQSPDGNSRAAPYTPTRAAPTSGLPSSSPYATIKASAGPSLPVTPSGSNLPVTELKKVSFRMGNLKIVYPINGPNGPLAPWEEGKTRKRVNGTYRTQQRNFTESGEFKGWTSDDLYRLYLECCRTQDEPGIERVKRLLKESTNPPRVIDISNELLSIGAVNALSDLLTVDFGLKKLIIENAGLDDQSLKPLLHAMLISCTPSTLNISGNQRIRLKGWKLIAIFLRRASFLRYVDLSHNVLDKKAVEYLVQALMPTSRSDSTKEERKLTREESKKEREREREENVESETEPQETEQAIEDEYADITEDDEPLFYKAPLLRSDKLDEGCILSLRLDECGLRGQALEAFANGIRLSNLKNLSIRRNKITSLHAVSVAVMIRDYQTPHDQPNNSTPPMNSPNATHPPSFAFEPRNTVTARESLPYMKRIQSNDSVHKGSEVAKAERDAWANSEARNQLKRKIEELPRVGSLLTLDLKGNELKGGVTYLAQALKRNRTLKVLNLSENRIDIPGLVSIAEALKFNSTLETLDVSFNPCCGPGIEGISALRSAITINSSLKRVFLNSTDLTSEGAIALAEFLPESHSLLHLDLTGNYDIDIAGVMALSVAVKMNQTIRCLDLNIPPNDADFARLSQEILQCCVRNTELAQEESNARGSTVTVAAPILKSAVARDLKSRQEEEERKLKYAAVVSKSQKMVILAAEECGKVLGDILSTIDQEYASGGQPNEDDLSILAELLDQAKLAEEQLHIVVTEMESGKGKDFALELQGKLMDVIESASMVNTTLLPAQSKSSQSSYHSIQTPNVQPAEPGPSTPPNSISTGLMSPPIKQSPTSPAFSLIDSDEEESELDVKPVVDASPSSPTLARQSRITLDTSSDSDENENDDTLDPKISSQSRVLTMEEGEVFRKGNILLGVSSPSLNEEDMSDSPQFNGHARGFSQDDMPVIHSSWDSNDTRDDKSGEELRKELLEATEESLSRGILGEPSSPNV